MSERSWTAVLLLLAFGAGLMIGLAACPEVPVEPMASRAVTVTRDGTTLGRLVRITDTLPETGTIVHCYVTHTGTDCIMDPMREPAQ